MAMVGMIAGTALSAMGAMSSASAQASAAQADAAAADYNAAIAKRNKQIIGKQNERDIEDKRSENRRQMGQIRAAYGASGLGLGGSPLDVLADSAVEMEYDVQKMDYKARVRMAEQHDRAQLYQMEEEAAESRAEQARTAGFIGAASSIVSGFTRMASSGATGVPGFSAGY